MGIYKQGFDYKYSLDKDVLILKTDRGQYKFKIENSEVLENIHDIASLIIRELQDVESKKVTRRDSSNHYAKLLLATLSISEKYTKLEKKYNEVRNVLEELQALKSELRHSATSRATTRSSATKLTHQSRVTESSLNKRNTATPPTAAPPSAQSLDRSSATPPPVKHTANQALDKQQTDSLQRSTSVVQAKKSIARSGTHECSAKGLPPTPPKEIVADKSVASVSADTAATHSVPSTLQHSVNRKENTETSKTGKPDADITVATNRIQKTTTSSSSCELEKAAQATKNQYSEDDTTSDEHAPHLTSAVTKGSQQTPVVQAEPYQSNTDKDKSVPNTGVHEVKVSATNINTHQHEISQNSVATVPQTSGLPALSAPVSVKEKSLEIPDAEKETRLPDAATTSPAPEVLEKDEHIVQQDSAINEPAVATSSSAKEVTANSTETSLASAGSIDPDDEMAAQSTEMADSKSLIADSASHYSEYDGENLTGEEKEVMPSPNDDEVVEPVGYSTRHDSDNAGYLAQHYDQSVQSDEYQLPLLSFLHNTSSENLVDQERIRSDAELLEKKLGHFGIRGEVMGIHPGPVITTYEYKPEPGIKISKIVNLADDLALALSAYSIRIVAPIPGKDVMGIEIPNIRKSLVPFIDIVTSADFKESNSKVPICLGKNIVGDPVVVELESMPHLLIAGATGTGKSVGLNAMITSILYKANPDEVRFMMIDPKRIELSFYNDIPHLLTPVITDMNKANIALQWLVREMDRRYNLLAEFQVRHIEQFNQKLADSTTDQYGENGDKLEPLPYIVVIIDELADLMMTASRDIEFSLTRLAQMARAAGIHLILATQRPSVDVLTGIIKANFPTRISFQVSSKTDSRTIIDSNGAETLLGNGDMLFVPPGTARLTRVHGTYLSESELVDITTFIKQQRKPNYIYDVLAEQDSDAFEPNGKQDEFDEKYNEALDYVMTTRQASISGVQRALRVGYNRAARIIDLMEKNGVVGPPDGAKPRKVLVNTMNVI